MKYHHRWDGITLVECGRLTLVEAVVSSDPRVARSESCLNWIGTLILTLCGCLACFSNPVAAQEECQLNHAVAYHAVMSLVTREAIQKQLTPQAAQAAREAAHKQIRGSLSQSCFDEIKAAAGVEDKNCQKLIDAALSKEWNYFAQANSNFDLKQDRVAYAKEITPILIRVLTSIPHECWFRHGPREVPPKTPPGYTPAQCAQLWANYEECKSEVEVALKKCAVWPGPGPCPDLGPYCMLPPCSK